MRKIATFLVGLFAAICLFACDASPSDGGTVPDDGNNGGEQVQGTELYKDTNFTAFGVTEALGAEWSGSTLGHTGRITKYRAVNKQLNMIPYGKATEDDGVTAVEKTKDVHWDFIEGEKYNITDPEGNKLSELLDFRTCVGAKLVENTDSKLVFEQYNDYLHENYPDKYPVSNPKLVKRVETDKKGTIKLCYNSYNDISNVAYSFTSKFANNTWPHLYLNQNFHEPIDLALYEKITYGVTVQVDKAVAVNNWPMGASDRYDQPPVPSGEPKVSVAQLQGYFLFRDKSNPTKCWFAGLCYFSTNASDRNEGFMNEQHGVPFYRIGLAQDQGAYYDMTGNIIAADGTSTRVTLDLTKQIKYIMDRHLKVGEKYADGRVNPYYGKTADDYIIADYHIGWENMGNWDCEATVSGLTCRGVLKQ